MCKWKKFPVVILLCVCMTGISLINLSESAHAAEVQSYEHQKNISIKAAGGETSNGSVWDSIVKWWKQHHH